MLALALAPAYAASDADAMAKHKSDYEARFSNPYRAAEYGYVDDVIEPSQTRARLARGLETLRNKSISNPKKKHGNIPL